MVRQVNKDNPVTPKNKNISLDSIDQLAHNMETRIGSKIKKIYLPLCGLASIIIIGIFWAGYLMTVNLDRIANSMSNNTNGVQTHMASISGDISSITKVMENISSSMKDINNNFEKTNSLFSDMNTNVKEMTKLSTVAKELNTSIKSITKSIKHMDGLNDSVSNMSDRMNSIDKSVYFMGRDVNGLSRGISAPMGMFDSMPFPF